MSSWGFKSGLLGCEKFFGFQTSTRDLKSRLYVCFSSHSNVWRHCSFVGTQFSLVEEKCAVNKISSQRRQVNRLFVCLFTIFGSWSESDGVLKMFNSWRFPSASISSVCLVLIVTELLAPNQAPYRHMCSIFRLLISPVLRIFSCASVPGSKQVNYVSSEAQADTVNYVRCTYFHKVFYWHLYKFDFDPVNIRFRLSSLGTNGTLLSEQLCFVWTIHFVERSN